MATTTLVRLSAVLLGVHTMALALLMQDSGPPPQAPDRAPPPTPQQSRGVQP